MGKVSQPASIHAPAVVAMGKVGPLCGAKVRKGGRPHRIAVDGGGFNCKRCRELYTKGQIARRAGR
jgi:hypothetical protein